MKRNQKIISVLNLIHGAYYNLHKPQRVIARSASDKAIQNNEIATPYGLVMTTSDGSNVIYFMLSVLIALSVLIGMLLIEPLEAHGQTKAKVAPSYERDPFGLPSGVRLLSKSGPAPVAEEKLRTPEGKPLDISLPLTVKAVLISDRIRLASIDRQIVTVGDTIHDEKVLEIKPDRVILGKGNQKRTIFLIQSPVKLTVEER